jgi:hypothetical protein
VRVDHVGPAAAAVQLLLGLHHSKERVTQRRLAGRRARHSRAALERRSDAGALCLAGGRPSAGVRAHRADRGVRLQVRGSGGAYGEPSLCVLGGGWGGGVWGERERRGGRRR